MVPQPPPARAEGLQKQIGNMFPSVADATQDLLALWMDWKDTSIFQELTDGFRLLGPLAPGLGWKRRTDSRYADQLTIPEFLVKNKQYVLDKLRRCRVDPCWKQMADEVAADVELGRMEGPFSSPSDWPKKAVPLASHSHTARLLPGPKNTSPLASLSRYTRSGRTASRRLDELKTGDDPLPTQRWLQTTHRRTTTCPPTFSSSRPSSRSTRSRRSSYGALITNQLTDNFQRSSRPTRTWPSQRPRVLPFGGTPS